MPEALFDPDANTVSFIYRSRVTTRLQLNCSGAADLVARAARAIIGSHHTLAVTVIETGTTNQTLIS